MTKCEGDCNNKATHIMTAGKAKVKFYLCSKCVGIEKSHNRKAVYRKYLTTETEDIMIKEWNKIFNQRNPYDPNKTLSNFDVTGMIQKFIIKMSKKVNLKSGYKEM